jgi:hypothetical protein
LFIGGSGNYIGAGASACSVGGGGGNNIGYSCYGSTISGGFNNSVAGSDQGSVIGGGEYNQILAGASGGYYATAIVGGYDNSIGTNVFYSAIGGGYNNVIPANSQYATIPGGGNNVAGSFASFAAGYEAQATNEYAFVWGDGSAVTASSINNSVTFRASNGYRFFTGGGTAGAQLAPGATAWSTLSDRNVKKNFRPVDTAAVLSKLAAMPIQQWNYQWETDADVPNIGPMAQDFKQAFYPGRDDKSITTLEFDGVELAAIQGLNNKLEDKDSKIKKQSAEIADLKVRLEVLERIVLKQNAN